jgi:hypothetical protein
MKEVKLLIGDYEYAAIQEIFEKEKDFKPITDKDIIIVKTLEAVISPNNLMEEDVGGPETESTVVAPEFLGQALAGSVEDGPSEDND